MLRAGSRDAAKCVFVGNIPYDATEQQLRDIFNTVGKVISFRLVSDRDTAKPKGYGFCEFEDAETAQSAIRNLNNYDFGGRSLRVDRATVDTSFTRESTPGGGSGKPLYEKHEIIASKPVLSESIVSIVQALSQKERVEILTHMKALIEQNPNGAKQLLSKNPQLGQALLTIQVLFGLVTAEDIQKLQQTTEAEVSQSPLNAHANQAHPQPSPGFPAQAAPAALAAGSGRPMPPHGIVPLHGAPGMVQATPAALVGPPPQQHPPPQHPPDVSMSTSSAAPSTAVPSQPSQQAPPNAEVLSAIEQMAQSLPSDQKQILAEVMNLKPEDIQQLPTEVQKQVLDLQAQITRPSTAPVSAAPPAHSVAPQQPPGGMMGGPPMRGPMDPRGGGGPPPDFPHYRSDPRGGGRGPPHPDRWGDPRGPPPRNMRGPPRDHDWDRERR